jgi:hypothetical protein
MLGRRAGREDRTRRRRSLHGLDHGRRVSSGCCRHAPHRVLATTSLAAASPLLLPQTSTVGTGDQLVDQEERGLPVAPAVAVAHPGGHRQPEPAHRRAGRGERSSGSSVRFPTSTPGCLRAWWPSGSTSRWTSAWRVEAAPHRQGHSPAASGRQRGMPSSAVSPDAPAPPRLAPRAAAPRLPRIRAGGTSTRPAAAGPTTTTRATVATTRPVEPTATTRTASPGCRTRRRWTRLPRSREHVRAGARRRGS